MAIQAESGSAFQVFLHSKRPFHISSTRDSSVFQHRSASRMCVLTKSQHIMCTVRDIFGTTFGAPKMMTYMSSNQNES